MPVKHALLALLAQRELTGYELKLRFERTLGDFWQLNSGQVYSTLERLRREGCVARQKETGTVEKGKSADLLLVAGDPTKDVANFRKVRYVVRGGVVRSIEELKATVAAAK